MSKFDDQIASADTVIYDQFGDAASYTPPGAGEAVPCRVIIDNQTEILDMGGTGQTRVSGMTASVLESTIAEPKRGGQFRPTEGKYSGKVLEYSAAPVLDAEEWTGPVSVIV